MRSITVAVIVASLIGAGCARRAASPLPTYHGLDDAASLNVLAERAKAVKSLSSQCRLTLTRPDGQSVQLEGAIVMAPPDRLRLRAWKFNQAVFDLTMTPEGLWVMAPQDPGRREKVLPASLSAAQFGREWAMLNGFFFLQPDLSTEASGKWFNVRRRLEDGRTVLCRVDRGTLTPRQFEMRDAEGRLRFRFTLDDYRMIEGIPWPTTLAARSSDGKIDIRLKDVELNQELAPTAFRPPRRAEKHE
jgi:outer membrane lipoprotein-sorting protein